MYNDADVETYAKQLRSTDSAARALAADDATDGVSDWGSTPTQSRRLVGSLGRWSMLWLSNPTALRASRS